MKITQIHLIPKLLFVVKLSAFCVLWMWFYKHTNMKIEILENSNISIFLYGASLFVGGKILYFCIEKFIENIKSIKSQKP